MELPRSYANFMLDDDDNYKVYVFSSILRLETIFGPIQHKFAKGKQSVRILEKLRTQQVQPQHEQAEHREIDAMIMLDRDVDLVSPFCIQQTYEGQVDESIGLSMGKALLDRKIIDSYYN